MTNTQRPDQVIRTRDPVLELAAAAIAVTRQAGRAVAELWLGLMQWG